VGCDCKFNPLALGQIRNGADSRSQCELRREMPSSFGGRIVPLNPLRAGQRATVLQLPARAHAIPNRTTQLPVGRVVRAR
jgi:hypothetical protein